MNVSSRSGRVDVTYILPVADGSKAPVSASGTVYVKPHFGNNTPTDNAIHFVNGKLGFDSHSIYVDANRCYGPIMDRSRVPAQVTVIGDVLSTDSSSVSIKVCDSDE